jgi:hypothetical protein
LVIDCEAGEWGGWRSETGTDAGKGIGIGIGRGEVHWKVTDSGEFLKVDDRFLDWEGLHCVEHGVAMSQSPLRSIFGSGAIDRQYGLIHL